MNTVFFISFLQFQELTTLPSDFFDLIGNNLPAADVRKYSIRMMT